MTPKDSDGGNAADSGISRNRAKRGTEVGVALDAADVFHPGDGEMRGVRPPFRFDAQRQQSRRKLRVQAGKRLRARLHSDPKYSRRPRWRKSAKPRQVGIEATNGKRPIDRAQDLFSAIAGYVPDEPESDVKVGGGNPPRVDTTFELAAQRIRDRSGQVPDGIVQLYADEYSQEP